MAGLKVQDVAFELIRTLPSLTANRLTEMVRERTPSCECSAAPIAWYQNKLKHGARSKTEPVRLSEPRPGTGTSLWPVWAPPNNDDLFAPARLTTPYVRFLSPEAVRLVVDDNERHRAIWTEMLSVRGIDPALYVGSGLLARSRA
jgi:hypothetical protein